MFRALSTGLFLFPGTLLTVLNGRTLLDFRGSVEGLVGVSLEEYEALTSSSNLGSYCTVARLESCFAFLCGVLLLIVGTCVRPQDRGLPALGVGLGFLVTAHSEYAISTNTFSVQVYQGEFTKLLGNVAYINMSIGLLLLMVAGGTLVGLAEPASSSETAAPKKTK